MTRTRTEITTLTLVRRIVEDLDDYPAAPRDAVIHCPCDASDADEPSRVRERPIAKCGASNVYQLKTKAS